ncbi:hypothetical protein PS862_04530 [Pseudomonas fluorescens]|uniref:Uncharacterized protein n=1 Tax=Pseudomonas fluorescens TaxID=294 RepID=A0A5E7NB88_PSEFL|nr:hypothetical protein [Pseudomonas fluorescens]VVP34149.1 hypothetical protein PS862_04530 [Pseudomonas fluorescens]
MKWMYSFTPSIQYVRPSKVSIDSLRGGILRVAFRLSALATAGYLLLLILQYIISLLIIYKLSSLVSAEGPVRFTIGDGAILLSLALCSFLVVVGQLNLERYFSLRICSIFDHLLSRHTRSGVPLSALERLASRDLNVVLDGIAGSFNLFAIPLFLMLAMLGAVSLYGATGFGAVALIAAFIPLSYGLSKLSDRNYKRIMDKVTQRIEQCSTWLKDGPLLKQFLDPTSLRVVEQTLSDELSLRDRDTLLRGADSYIIGFGRLIPFVLLTFWGAGVNLLPWDGVIFWLAIPLISAMLGLPRAFLSFKVVDRSLIELDALFEGLDSKGASPLSASDGNSAVQFDEHWPIWPSSLIALVPGHHPDKLSEVESLLIAFRLLPELGCNVQAVADKLIEMDASNLSNGQRLRLQLIRGVFLARAQNRFLLIDHDLSSLDSAAARSVMDALERMPDVQFSQAAVQAIECRVQNVETGAALNPPEMPRCTDADGQHFGLLNLMKLCSLGVIALLVPAVMMSYAGNLTLPPSDPGAGWVLAYVAAGVASGVCAGLFIESSLRRRLTQHISLGLNDVCAGDSANGLQIVSRDITTVFERIAWYAHDISWISALLACSVGVLWLGFGLPGLILALFFAGSLMGLYHLSVQELYRTRTATVAGFDALIRSAQASYSIASASVSSLGQLSQWLANTRHTLAMQGVAHFYQSRRISVIARTVTAASCTLLSDLVIVLNVMLGGIFQSSSYGFVLAVTAVLLVRSDLSNVFLAITGFKSQSISVERLLRFGAIKQRVPLQVVGGLIHIAGFAGQRSYKPTALHRGGVQLLRGASGVGKSDYPERCRGSDRDRWQLCPRMASN